MNNKFKLLSILGAMIISGALFGCGDKDDVLSSSPTTPPTSSPSNPSTSVNNTEDEIITLKEASEIALAAGDGTKEKYKVKGIIKAIDNAIFGNMTITDETGELYIYGLYSADGSTKYENLENKPVAGDEVTLLGILKNYKGKAEMEDAWLIDHKHNEPDIDLDNYTVATIEEARKASVNANLKVKGVVAFVTNANGFKPNGFYLVDKTGSIYVYGNQVAQQVKVGNTVEIAATRTNFIAENEANNAQKYGYQGAIQLQNPYLLSNDKKESEWDKSWISESSVYDMMNTPVTDNITTNIYKVDAYVKEKPGNGFTNFYIYDIDGETGSYVYTMCNGDDFTYLRAFDGKICTVYLSAINMKASSSGVIYRFIPIAVVDEGYTFDESKAPNFALDFYIKKQFNENYFVDPSLEVITSVSNEIHKLDNIAISYSSSDENVAFFETIEGKTYFHLKNAGEATITVKADYKSYSASETLKVTKIEVPEYSAISIAESFDKNDQEVTLEGIVGASLVNQTGFYLIDETGAIAIRCNDDLLAKVALGNKVVLKGTKVIFDSSKGLTTQNTIINPSLIVNFLGNHQYSDSSFITETFENIVAKAATATEDNSKVVYKTKAKVVYVEETYYTTYKLTSEDGSKTLNLYCANGGQYSFLLPYNGQYIDMDLALCDWNNKNNNVGCVVAIYVNGNRIVNDSNFK